MSRLTGPPKPIPVEKKPFPATDFTRDTLYGKTVYPPSGAVQALERMIGTPRQPTAMESRLSAVNDLSVQPLEPPPTEVPKRIDPFARPQSASEFAADMQAMDIAQRGRVPLKELPGTEDVVASSIARRLQSGNDKELSAAYADAIKPSPVAAERFRRLVASRLPVAWQRYADYAAMTVLNSEALPLQVGAATGGLDLDAVFTSMSEKTTALEKQLTEKGLRLNLPSELTPHQRAIEIRRQLSAKMDRKEAERLSAPHMEDVGKLVAVLKAVIADANGDNHDIFVPPSPRARPPRLGPLRVNEPPLTFNYDEAGGTGSRVPLPWEKSRERYVTLGKESEQQPRSLKAVPQESAGRAMRELILSNDRENLVTEWNTAADSWRVLPLEEGTQVSPEKQALRQVLADADLSKGIAADGLERLAQMAGYDTSQAAIQEATNTLAQFQFESNRYGPLGTDVSTKTTSDLLSFVATMDDQGIAVLAVGMRNGTVTVPEKWGSGKPDSLGKTLAEAIASGQDADRLMMATNALYPDEFYRIATTDVGEFSEYQPGMHFAAVEVATDLQRLAGKSAPLRGQPGMTTTRLVDSELATGLARASRQYVADDTAPQRPPLRIDDGINPQSPEFLSLLEQTTANPFPVFGEWLAKPQTQAVLTEIKRLNPSFTGAQAIQKAVNDGTMPMPVYKSEGQAFEMRKTILKNLWELELKNPKDLTPNKIEFYRSLGINVPEPIVAVSRNSSPVIVEQARRAVEMTDEGGINLDQFATDFAESLRAR